MVVAMVATILLTSLTQMSSHQKEVALRWSLGFGLGSLILGLGSLILGPKTSKTKDLRPKTVFSTVHTSRLFRRHQPPSRPSC